MFLYFLICSYNYIIICSVRLNQLPMEFFFFVLLNIMIINFFLVEKKIYSVKRKYIRYAKIVKRKYVKKIKVLTFFKTFWVYYFYVQPTSRHKNDLVLKKKARVRNSPIMTIFGNMNMTKKDMTVTWQHSVDFCPKQRKIQEKNFYLKSFCDLTIITLWLKYKISL